jgi:hypothetical protein
MTAGPETDPEFRKRILRVADERDFREISMDQKRDLDVIGRRYGRFRYGVPLADTKKPGTS